jgi:hypothetical protein|mmetsp:Transcript_35392/g.59422  ORF Transcript_35392/g.59422 Transcript_35392/m.59422 type:complete len:147 (-) Transcript_35392:684-1124(-)
MTQVFVALDDVHWNAAAATEQLTSTSNNAMNYRHVNTGSIMHNTALLPVAGFLTEMKADQYLPTSPQPRTNPRCLTSAAAHHYTTYWTRKNKSSRGCLEATLKYATRHADKTLSSHISSRQVSANCSQHQHVSPPRRTPSRFLRTS